jgi:hypothetical protein
MNIEEVFKKNEKKQINPRIFMFVLFVLVIFGIVWLLIAFNPFQGKKTQINEPGGTATLFSTSLPKGYIADSSFFSKSGIPVAIFSADSEKAVAEKDKEKLANWYDKDARVILVFIFGKNTVEKKREVSFFDNRFSATTGFEKMIVESKKVTGGEYRCSQARQGEKILISCFLTNADKSSALFEMQTNASNQKKDMKNLYKIIQTTKVSK